MVRIPTLLALGAGAVLFLADVGIDPRLSRRARRPRSPRRRPSIPSWRRPISGGASAPNAAGGRSRSAASRASEGGVLRRGRRRTLENDRRRRELGAGHRRPDPSASVGAVAVSESNPDIVFIGMGETCIRGNIMPGDGVVQVHRCRQDLDARRLRAMRTTSRGSASTRRTPTSSFVAAFGKYGAPNDERGVFKSTDGGRTWTKVLFRDDKTGAVDLSIDPQESQRNVCRALGGVPHRIPDVERRARQRPVQVHGRRRDLDGDHPQPGSAGGRDRPHRRLGLGRRLRIASTRWSRTRTAACSSRRCGRDLDARERRTATSGSARSTTRTSPPIRRTPTWSTC